MICESVIVTFSMIYLDVSCCCTRLQNEYLQTRLIKYLMYSYPGQNREALVIRFDVIVDAGVLDLLLPNFRVICC